MRNSGAAGSFLLGDSRRVGYLRFSSASLSMVPHRTVPLFEGSGTGANGFSFSTLSKTEVPQ